MYTSVYICYTLCLGVDGLLSIVFFLFSSPAFGVVFKALVLPYSLSVGTSGFWMLRDQALE